MRENLEKIEKVETVYNVTNKLGYSRNIFVNGEVKDHMALADYVGEAMSGAFKQWYKKADLVADLRATADIIEKFDL